LVVDFESIVLNRAERVDVEAPVHHGLRAALARARGAHRIAFVAHGVPVGCKKRLVAHPDEGKRFLARVVQAYAALS
jgi:hypothetical protein